MLDNGTNETKKDVVKVWQMSDVPFEIIVIVNTIMIVIMIMIIVIVIIIMIIINIMIMIIMIIITQDFNDFSMRGSFRFVNTLCTDSTVIRL